MSFKAKKQLSAIAAATLLLSLTSCGDEAQQQAMGPLPVDIYTVVNMDVPVVSHLTGRANPTRKAEVRPQVSGVIQKRLFEEGSTVEAGMQLYQIDPRVYEANVASAKASLSSARATLRSTRLKYERYANLLKKNAVSQQDYDDAEAAYLSAQAAVESATAQLQSANIDLGYTKVFAPISGTISRSDVTEGALVSAQQTTALTTIQQLDPIYVDLGQTVEDNLQLRQKAAEGKVQNANGKPTVDITFTNGEKYQYQGTLEFAEVSVDESTGMVNLRALVPNPDHLILPSMFLHGDINEGIVPDAVVITATGVQREPGGTSYAYIVDAENKVQRANLKLGNQTAGYYEVLEGLQPGDKVIVSNIQKIHIGMVVEPIIPNAESAEAEDNNGAAASSGQQQ